MCIMKIYIKPLRYALKIADKNDTILLIGAQGMDPANNMIMKINKNLE